MDFVQVDENNHDSNVVNEVCDYLTSTPSKSFFLFAGAGSGKTRTLVEVLRRLTGVEEDKAGSKFAEQLLARAQSIRVITYTRNAAAVIEGRLGENALTRVSTIHGFCWDFIAGFDEDIRNALLALNQSKLDTAKDAAQARKKGPTPKDIETISDLEKKSQTLQAIPRFIYNPDRNTYGDGALQHDQVLSVTTWLLKERPTLRRALVDKHPIILIDESQDTMRKVLGALMDINREDSASLALGLIGDHRQRIYPDGHKDLPSLVPSDWKTPSLKMNHRSQQRIVSLINNIWQADIEGRTQSKAGVIQTPRADKSGGTVRIYVCNTNINAEDKIRVEKSCAKNMASASGAACWLNPQGGYQLLALEHKLAARRGGFLDVYNALSLIDKEATRPQGNIVNTGPTAVQLLLRELPALTACKTNQDEIDEFAVVELLNQFDRLKDLPRNGADFEIKLAEFHEAAKEIIEVSSRPDSTVREILAPVIRSHLFEVDDRLLQAFHDHEPIPAIPSRKESREEKRLRGWRALLDVRWSELRRYRDYLHGESNLATHQVVKGSEFPHVMVIMDDLEAGGFLFAYDKLFGAVKLSKSDLDNMKKEEETSVDRTLRLLYMTCSRAKESLALVLWSSNTKVALQRIKESGWFSEEEVIAFPEPWIQPSEAPY